MHQSCYVTSADLSANPMQVSSREISEAWHIRSGRFVTENRNVYPRVGCSGFNLTVSYFVLSEMTGCRPLSPCLGRELQLYVNMVHVESARVHIAYS